MSDHATHDPVSTADAVNGDAAMALNRYQSIALGLGIGGAILLLLGGFIPKIGTWQIGGWTQFFQSYLYAFMFFVGVPLGCLGFLMLQHLVGGPWGLVIRRIIEAGTRVLPLMAVLFVPILVGGIAKLYRWAQPGYHVDAKKFQFKHDWLQPKAFIIRSVIYFVTWLLLVVLLNKFSKDQDRINSPHIAKRMRIVSAPGLILYVLLMTFAAFDWVMSLDPDWYSTIFGLLTVVGQGLSTLCVCIIVLTLIGTRKPYSSILQKSHFHDIGNLMFAFTILWAYMSYSQYLIIWAGNVAEETPWYYYRSETSWKWIGLFLVVFHFAIPFLLLLNRKVKRSPQSLATVAALLIFMRFVDLKWVTGPAFQKPIHHHGIDVDLSNVYIHFHWMDLMAILAIGGIWVFFFIAQLKRRPLLPVNDPRLPAALSAMSHGGHH